MASTSPLTLVTPRDIDLFHALDHTPLTVRQLLALSQTFAYPFTSERRVQERLANLCIAGRVRRYRYATAGPGAQSYFTLSPEGYRILHGHDAPLPRSHAFAPIAVARQHHTQSLADYIVHTSIAAHNADIRLENFYRENALCLQVGAEHLFPDCAFQIPVAGPRAFQFYVEVDNSTEPLRSPREANSWDRKIRMYESLAHQTGERFRVLVVTTRSSQRLHHILTAAADSAQNSHRSLFYGVTLAAYLKESDPLHAACFVNHRKQPVAILPSLDARARPPLAADPSTDSADIWYDHPLLKPPSDVRAASTGALPSPPIASFRGASDRGSR